MITHCKWCGIMYLQTEDKLEYCSEYCKKADNGELEHEKKSENFINNVAG